MRNFKLNLKEVRQKAGLFQEELAEKLNTTQQRISEYELGKTVPSLNRLIELAQILDVSLDDLVEFKKIQHSISKDLNE